MEKRRKTSLQVTKKTMRNIVKNREMIFLALPGLVFLFLFYYLPMYGFALPFVDYDQRVGLLNSVFVGFDNFKYLFSQGVNMAQITLNTVTHNFRFIIYTMVVSIILALIMAEMKSTSVKIYQTCFFVPYFVSWVVVSYVVYGFLSMDYGFINSMLVRFHGTPVMWYNTPKPWPIIVVIAVVWKDAGYYCLIYYTSLISIDKQIYEAAEIDGASKLQQIRYISLPLLMPAISMLFILQIGRIFYGNFDLFYNIARNSSATYATMDVIDTYVYRALRQFSDVGMSSAACVYQSIVGFVLVMGSNLLVKKLHSDYALF